MPSFRLLAAACIAATVFQTSVQITPPRREYVEYLMTTDHPDRTYSTGETPTIRIEAYKGGNPLDGVTVKYKTGDEMMSMTADSVKFIDGVATIPMGTRQTPGFRSCEWNFTVYGKTYKDLVKTAFSPEKIESCTPMPSDFKKFWDKQLRAAEKIPLNPEITPLPAYSNDSIEVSLVKLTVGSGGRHMYGYLSKPRDGKKHPVLFSPPGAGAKRISPSTTYAKDGFIYLNINIHSGCNPELPDDEYAAVQKAVEDYNRNGISDRDSFYYRDVYAGCSRCIDFLCSLPEWDGKNVGVTGGSQGGALSIVTAALNPKVKFCAPFYPALCDVLGFRHNRAGGWPKYFRNTEEAPGAENTLPYYDVVNFARILTCPVFYSFGYNDETCSPTSTYSAYNAITSDKTLRVTPTSGHWRFPETNSEATEWIKQQCKF